MYTIALTITALLTASAAGVLLYIASIGGFDPSKRVMTDPVEGTETQVVENPTRPEHPGFPPATTNNLSLSSGVNGNDSLATQALLKVSTAMIFYF
jgi:hypothetical protein